MKNYWKKPIESKWVTNQICNQAVTFAEEFGFHLAKKDDVVYEDKDLKKVKVDFKGKPFIRQALSTNQLRKFFGEVKRQQNRGFVNEDFILLKPKLAYAVGRAKDPDAKINDFYIVITDLMKHVNSEDSFKRFIKIFEAIVAYHKAAEDSNLN